jgi:hypothetical protein
MQPVERILIMILADLLSSTWPLSGIIAQVAQQRID